MGRPDGLSILRLCATYWRTTATAGVIVACIAPGSRHFMLNGLVPALLWLAAGLATGVAVLGVIIWRRWRRNRRATRARQAEIRQAGSCRPVFGTAYPGHEAAPYPYSVHPELITYGTATGRFLTGPEQAGNGHTTWPVRRDQEPGAAAALNPGHE